MIKHVTSVDQSDRKVPYNLRQSGSTPVQMLISTCWIGDYNNVLRSLIELQNLYKFK